MKRLVVSTMLGAVAVAWLTPSPAWGARRRVVVRHTRTTLVVHRGFPIRRTLPRTVVVRPARTTVVVGASLVFLPAVIWSATPVSLPPRERLVWEDSEVITRDQEWVECNFGVDNRGDALLLEIDGRAQLNFAEVAFANGQVQVVDFQGHTRSSGAYQLLDFADGRHVKTVRILARSKSPQTTFKIYMRK